MSALPSSGHFFLRLYAFSVAYCKQTLLESHKKTNRSAPEHRIQVVVHPTGLIFKCHVRHIVYAVQCALWVSG
jgi:hypothetical protein